MDNPGSVAVALSICIPLIGGTCCLIILGLLVMRHHQRHHDEMIRLRREANNTQPDSLT
jgi:hypothetical protein